jgi:hypothetical protein
MNWLDKAEESLETDYNSGFITYQEFLSGMRDLRAEVEQGRQDAADRARDDYDNY